MRTTITTSALVQRMKRALKREGQVLKKSRPREYHDLGEYHVIDNRNIVINSRISIQDLYKMAIDRAVVGKNERLVDA